MRGLRIVGRKRRARLETSHWRLHVARLGSLLGKARAVRRLVDDARETIDDDYIFDGQYPLTLVDRVLENLDGVAFDAEVLGLETTPLEEELRRVHVAARRLQAADDEEDGSAGEESEEPEVAQLRRVLAWMAGPLPNGDPTAMGFLHRTVDTLLGGLLGDTGEPSTEACDVTSLTLPGGCQLSLVDLGGGIAEMTGSSAALSDIRCEPLSLLLTGAVDAVVGSDRGSDRAGSTDRWLAVIDRFHVSLRPTSKEPRLILEATHTGRDRRDWLFVYELGRSDRGDWPGESIMVEPTEAGCVLWSVGSGESMEELLIRAGAKLIAGSESAETSQHAPPPT